MALFRTPSPAPSPQRRGGENQGLLPSPLRGGAGGLRNRLSVWLGAAVDFVRRAQLQRLLQLQGFVLEFLHRDELEHLQVVGVLLGEVPEDAHVNTRVAIEPMPDAEPGGRGKDKERLPLFRVTQANDQAVASR